MRGAGERSYKTVSSWISTLLNSSLLILGLARLVERAFLRLATLAPIGKESKEDLPNPQLITGGKLAFGKQALQAK